MKYVRVRKFRSMGYYQMLYAGSNHKEGDDCEVSLGYSLYDLVNIFIHEWGHIIELNNCANDISIRVVDK